MLLSDLAKRTLAAVSARTVGSNGLWGGGVMDPVVLAATSASIVEALSTDTWQQVRDRMVELFRRARPQEADDVSAEFAEARELVLLASGDAQSQVEYELTVKFQRRLQDLAREASSIDEHVLHLLNDLLASSRSITPLALSFVAARDAAVTRDGPLTYVSRLIGPEAPAAEDPSVPAPAYLPMRTVFDRLGPARMLPRDVPVFIGRNEEVRELLETASEGDEPAVCLVHGMPGVGKTALAVHVAHRLSESFPDGQLFINLRAHDPADEPASPYQLLGSLLTAAGFPAQVQPKSVHGRAGLWRSWLSSKRMMIILDDAADLAQVEPLLPGYPGCLTVVTSRLRLESAEVTKSIAVSELAPEASAELFGRLLRHRGASSDDDSASKVARLCGHLPLAVVFAASSLLTHPTWQVRHLIRELSDSPQRLVRLSGGHVSISKALNSSVQSLDGAERRFLRRLGMHPGPALEKHAAAVLADTTVEDADQRLDSLYRHSLLSEVSPGRFRMHVLVSSYCRATPLEEFADTNGPDNAGREEDVRQRLLNYYLRTATAAYLLETQQQPADVVVASLPDRAPALRDASQAAGWLAEELDNLAACTQYSADYPESVVDLAAVVIAHLLQRGDEGVQAAHVLVQNGEHRAASRRDVRAKVVFSHLSGLLRVAEDDIEDAEEAFHRAARMSLEGAWELGAARAFYGLYLALRLRHRYDRARDALDTAADLFARADDQPGLYKTIAAGAARPPSLPQQFEADWASSTNSATLTAPGDVLVQLEELVMQMQARHTGQEPFGPAVGPHHGLPATEPQSSEPETPHAGGGRGSGGGPHTPLGTGGSNDDEERPDSEGESQGEDALPHVLAAHELDEVDEQHINFWFADEPADDAPFHVTESRTGCFQVGPDHPQNLAEGERTIPPQDIPENGLDTRWIVSSSTCELSLPDNADPHAREGVTIAGDEEQWNVEFSLLIPPQGTSEERFVVITPRRAGTARIDAVVMVDGDPYRELTIEFPVEEPVPGPQDGPDSGSSSEPGSSPDLGDQPVGLPGQRPESPEASRTDEPPPAGAATRSLCAPRLQQRHRSSVKISARRRLLARETALYHPHAWQRPTHTLSLYVNPPSVWWSKKVTGTQAEQSDSVQWAPSATASQRVREAQAALNTYWQERAQRYNAISASDIANRLRQFQPRADWTVPSQRAQLDHEQAWAMDACSEQMRSLARAGRQLFQAMFPESTPLNSLVKELAPGDRLTIHWKDCTPHHVPWPLLFRGSMPPPGQPVQAQDFLGLRLRISHVVQPQNATRSLEQDAVRAHLMYWGGQPNDVTLHTAQEHAAELARWHPRVLPEGDQGRKEQLSAFLWDPAPVSLIYLFCQASTGTGNSPSLRFGSTSDACNVLQLTDMGDEPLTDKPLVFVNACDTSAAEHTYSNELQNMFLERGSRAYIGSECKVPTNFAARFASVFFHFLYSRSHSDAPTAAGEALAQTRKFFWDEYRSIGGLFYSYVNDHQIFFAKPNEVAAMHRSDLRPSRT